MPQCIHGIDPAQGQRFRFRAQTPGLKQDFQIVHIIAQQKAGNELFVRGQPPRHLARLFHMGGGHLFVVFARCPADFGQRMAGVLGGGGLQQPVQLGLVQRVLLQHAQPSNGIINAILGQA